MAQTNASPNQGMNLPKLFEQFGSDEKCRSYLEHLRWPDGPECPRWRYVHLTDRDSQAL